MPLSPQPIRVGSKAPGAAFRRHWGAMTNTKSFLFLIIVIAVLATRVASTYFVFNDVVDENVHLSGGLEYLQHHRYLIEVNHPPLARIFLAVLPYYLEGLRLPSGAAAWSDPWVHLDLGSYWRTLALSRSGNLIFAVLLVLVVYRWSAQVHGKTAALAACVLVTCSPTVIAHAGLATTDMACAATVVAASYLFWRWSERPGWRFCLLSALGLGLAFTSKFSAIVFLPPIAASCFILARWRHWKRLAGWRFGKLGLGLARCTAFIALAGGVVWAVYLFDFGLWTKPHDSTIVAAAKNKGPISATVVFDRMLDSKRLPSPAFWNGIRSILVHNRSGHRTYVLGETSRNGRWYYFPLALAVKTTLPLLALFGISLFLRGKERDPAVLRASLIPTVAAGVVLAVGMAANINIGVRHVLAVYPLMAIAGAGVFGGLAGAGRRRLAAVSMLLLLWHVMESVRAHPHYLAYFNQIARGEEHKFLADSNLDWGQDLANLKRYVRENRIEDLHLYYFGYTPPQRFGFLVNRECTKERGAHWVAVSVNNFLGLSNYPAGHFDLLTTEDKMATVGKSIWLYRVGADHPFVDRLLPDPERQPVGE